MLARRCLRDQIRSVVVLSANGFRFCSGTIHRASSGASDFTLVELDDPLNPESNAHWSGWDVPPDRVDVALKDVDPDGTDTINPSP